MDYKKMMKRKEIGRNLSIIFRATKSRFQECHNKHDFAVSMAEIPVLSFLIDESDEKEVSQDFITKSLGIDKASTTRAVKELMKLGYITRTRDKRDKRAYNLSLTQEGKKIKSQIMKMMLEWTNIIYNGVTEQEIEQLHNILDKMADNVRKYKEEKKYENN